MISDPDYLVEVCSNILNAAADILDDNGLAVPSRRYVSHGLPVHDCEQLVVWIDPLSTSPAVDQQCALIHKINVKVELVRSCWPGMDAGGSPPTAAEIDAAAVALLTDGWTLWRGLVQARGADLIPGVHCSRFTFNQALPLPPSGLMAGWRIEFSAELIALPAGGS